MSAQNPSGAYSPVNAFAEGEDAICCSTAPMWWRISPRALTNPARPSSAAGMKGVDLRFASAEHKALFEQEPERICRSSAATAPTASSMASPGAAMPIPGKSSTASCTFSAARLRKTRSNWMRPNLALAEQYWTEEIAGGNSFLQRVKRLVLRVPHYKSGEELANAVAEAQSEQERQ
jgi:hypothetical protein